MDFAAISYGNAPSKRMMAWFNSTRSWIAPHGPRRRYLEQGAGRATPDQLPAFCHNELSKLILRDANGAGSGSRARSTSWNRCRTTALPGIDPPVAPPQFEPRQEA